MAVLPFCRVITYLKPTGTVFPVLMKRDKQPSFPVQWDAVIRSERDVVFLRDCS